MSINEPFTELDINTEDDGFYKGYSLPIALVSKSIMVGLVLWALVWPAGAGRILGSVNGTLLSGFNSFYIVIVGMFLAFLLIVAILPATGKTVLGKPGQGTEFSNFSWFSMMFGAGLGVGLMVFATAEPLGLWGSNPVVVAGEVAPNTPEAVGSAYRYTFAHYGFHAWAIYVMTGLSLAYYAYTRDMPLTIRTALTPLFGRHVNGALGHIIDILGVIATILGVAVTIGFGVSQFIDGLYAISGLEFLMDSSGDAPTPSKVGLLAGLLVIMSLSILSAVSGVGKGVKYLSNLNLVLSVILLSVFILFGSFAFAMSTYVSAFLDYIINLASLSFGAYSPLSDANFTSALPEVAQPLAADLFAGATNAWGSLDGFKAGLSATAEATTAAAAISGEPLSAVYSAADVMRDGGDIDMDAFVALLPEAAAPMAAELSELAAKSGSPEALQATVAGLAESRTAAAALDDATLAAAYEAGNQGRQFGWQSGWTTFYWAWWIAFSPFVGLFLARISRGRSVREFIIGCVIAPSLVCFAWMTILGGTAIDLELSGAAEGAIIGASNTAKLFVTLEQMIQGPLFTALSVMCVVLIMTFLVTSADSGILVMNTIMSGGDQEAGVKHRIVWGVVLTLVIASLLLAGGGGLDALKNAMIIGALPFTAVMGLMMVSLAKAMWRDHLRAKESGQ